MCFSSYLIYAILPSGDFVCITKKDFLTLDNLDLTTLQTHKTTMYKQVVKDEYELNPSAHSLIQSMRDIGYTLNTAVADIIDNSITAQASTIDIIYTKNSNQPCLMIVDNGCGMSQDELLQALRFAHMGPTEERAQNDLGRFGLGLKTATFSQARRLVVITSKDEHITCAQWDLDYIVETKKWLLQVVDLDSLNIDSVILEKIKPHGTIVMWQNIDKFGNDDKHINSHITSLRDHIALVFHRFLDKKNTSFVNINLNNVPILAFDPYLYSNPHTVHHPIEKLRVKDSIVTIQTHILPHHKWLKKEEENFLITKSDLLNNQGFYVYRNNRLMVWGDWFRLLKKSESTKLARIEINFDNKLDAEWNIDIKKSKVVPPIVVKNRLVEIIETISNASKRVYQSRIIKPLGTRDSPWERSKQDGVIRYSVNVNSPLISTFIDSLDEVRKNQFVLILDVINNTLPLESIYADISLSAGSVKNQGQDLYSEEALEQKFMQILEFLECSSDKQFVLNVCQQSKLFVGNETKLAQWVDEYVK